MVKISVFCSEVEGRKEITKGRTAYQVWGETPRLG